MRKDRRRRQAVISSKIARVVIGLVLTLMLGSPRAHAYDFEISARSEAYAYQLRRYDGGGVVFLNRRRITQMLGLRVYKLFGTGQAPSRGGPDRAPAQIYLRTMLRFYADFGSYAEHPDATQELRNNRFELLLGSLEGRNLFGFLDFSLGRQYDMELFDFFAYDGFRLRLEGPKAFFVETYGGYRSTERDLFHPRSSRPMARPVTARTTKPGHRPLRSPSALISRAGLHVVWLTGLWHRGPPPRSSPVKLPSGKLHGLGRWIKRSSSVACRSRFPP